MAEIMVEITLVTAAQPCQPKNGPLALVEVGVMKTGFRMFKEPKAVY